MSMIATVGSTARTAARQAVGPALIAAALAVAAALTLRYLFTLTMPAELFADQATTRIPLPLFEAMLTTFGTAAKHLYLIGALVGESALTACVGVLYVVVKAIISARRGTPQYGTLSYVDTAGIVAALYVLSAAVLAPIVGGGFLGAGLPGGAGVTLISQIAPDVVFAVSLVVQLRSAAVLRDGLSAQEADTLTRRALLRKSGVAALTLGGAIAAWQALTSGLGSLLGASPASTNPPTLMLSGIPDRIVPPPVPTYGAYTSVVGQVPEVTAAADFYYVSKNLAGDPNVGASGWRLLIKGMVDHPYSLSYDQLRGMPSLTQYHTLECISNVVGGNLMSNGLFTGVRLADLLNTAGIQQGATQLIFTAADGYSDSLHLSQALDDRSLIVYLLDGKPLPTAHGFPARMLIPGLYGMKNGKWLTELSLASGAYDGYWEQRGWTHEAQVKLSSRIDIPHDGDLLVAKPMMVAGVAYSGANGIARVDVSVDGGHSWAAARLKRPLGALTWTLWEYPWTPAAGEAIIVVRAIDLDGKVQTTAQAMPLPDGSSGYHAISVSVR